MMTDTITTEGMAERVAVACRAVLEDFLAKTGGTE